MPSAQKYTGTRKTPRSSGNSATRKVRSAAGSVTRTAKEAASAVKSTAGSLGDKVVRGAKSVKDGTGLSTGQLLAGAAGLAAAATAGAVLYKKSNSGGRTVYHVKPNGEGWSVEGDGAGRATSTHGTKKEALTAARELAHGKVPSQLVVHRADGSVQEKFTYEAQ